MDALSGGVLEVNEDSDTMIPISLTRQYIIGKIFGMRDILRTPGQRLRQRKVEAARRANRTFITYIHAVRCRMIVDPDMFFSQVYVLGSYEPDLVRYLKKILRPGMTCIDAGANVGYFTLLMARSVGFEGRVISFEPTDYVFDLLKRNIGLNVFKHVVAEQLALFSHNGTIEFREGPPSYEVYNSAGTITHPSAGNQAFTSRSVPCVTLDHYLKTRHISKVDVIKLDVEGAELPVLKGMEITLEANPNAILIVELAEQTTRGFGYSAKDIGIWLIEKGWGLSLIKAFGRVSPTPVNQTWEGQMVVARRNS